MHLSTKVVPAPRTVFRELGSEALLLQLDRGLYFGLDEVATIIWRAFEERHSLGRTLDLLEKRYDTSPDRLRDDLLAFAQRTLDAELTRVCP